MKIFDHILLILIIAINLMHLLPKFIMNVITYIIFASTSANFCEIAKRFTSKNSIYFYMIGQASLFFSSTKYPNPTSKII